MRRGKMKTKFLLAMALPLLLPLAHATAPITATGTFTASFTILSIAHDGDNTIITVNENATLTGSLVGIRIAHGTETIHPDGTFEAIDTGTFTGTVNGVLGTLVITGHSNGTVQTGSGAGSFVVNEGTGGLVDFHGFGPFSFTATGPTSTTGSYSISLHTDA